jgi:hypothetical protein
MRVNEDGASGASVVHVYGGPVQGGGVKKAWSLTYMNVTPIIHEPAVAGASQWEAIREAG